MITAAEKALVHRGILIGFANPAARGESIVLPGPHCKPPQSESNG